ncbi:hypothetical protein GF318_05240 [Candidatus Micrarchaeota archaeon]|nr:hypothetical protein [Candidatus Micrarchaeota archaeon]
MPLRIPIHNGKTEEIPYRNISTVMVVPSPTMVLRKYWLLNFFHGRGRHKSLKFRSLDDIDEKKVVRLLKSVKRKTRCQS